MIQFKQVAVNYGGEQVLENVNLQVKEGETVLFTGLSGSGKSTLLKLVNGLIPHYDKAELAGQVRISGKDPRQMELYEISKLVSTVFQNPKTHFFNTDTSQELVFYLENIGRPRAEIKRRLAETVDLFQIHNLLNRSIFELSGGEKQILSIAQAYMSGNQIIVLDEPTANLDQIYTDKVGEMLRILRAKGKTILIAEHRFSFLKGLVDRVCLIQDRRIGAEFTGDQFFALPNKLLHDQGLRGLDIENLALSKTFVGEDLVIKKYKMDFQDHSIEIQDLGFNQSQIIGIIGRNGLGKSTLVRSLMGQTRAQTELYYQGKKLSKKQRLKKSYLVMQDVTAELFTESVLAECKLSGNHEKITPILQSLNLEAYKDRHPISLSGGQKQRLVIATCLLSDRPILFFDEPSSGMDHLHMKRVAELIEGIREGKIIFVISHDLELLQMICDQVLDLEKFAKGGVYEKVYK